MIPASAGATAGSDCGSSWTQPTGQSTVNSKEVLIGTTFYGMGNFTADNNCTCHTKYPMDNYLTGTMGVSGTVSAILDNETPKTGTAYNYLEPLHDANFTIH
jgi:hypothetical protein